jgi:hypothetical protein
MMLLLLCFMFLCEKVTVTRDTRPLRNVAVKCYVLCI